MRKFGNQLGFTLIELMTAAAIIGLLLSLAVPAFQKYSDRARFSEAILATNTYKVAVEIASSRGLINNLGDIQSGINGIPNFEFGFGGGNTTMHFVGVLNGTIFVLWPVDGSPLSGQSYILYADGPGSPIQWTEGGSCLSLGYC